MPALGRLGGAGVTRILLSSSNNGIWYAYRITVHKHVSPNAL